MFALRPEIMVPWKIDKNFQKQTSEINLVINLIVIINLVVILCN